MEVMKDIDNFFQEMENKYSSETSEVGDDLGQLHILSEEFNTLGLPSLDLKQPVNKLIHSVVNNAFLLIHYHRKTLSEITDINISQQSKDRKADDLKKTTLDLKLKLKTLGDQNTNLERKLFILTGENEQLQKRISHHNKETEKLKQFFKSKQNHLLHQINSLQQENHHFKEICGKDLDKYFSKEDKFLKILQTYRHKEEVYKAALQKLEDNNTEIMNEILNLKHELALAYLKG